MNVQLLREVQKSILSDPHGFNMQLMTRCIAGRTLRVLGKDMAEDLTRAYSSFVLNEYKEAALALELTPAQARELMNPNWKSWEWGPFDVRLRESCPNAYDAPESVPPEVYERHAKITAEFIDYFIAKHNPVVTGGEAPVVTSGAEVPELVGV